MRSIKHTLHAHQQRRQAARAKLPWEELEGEAARQGCSAADIFFDRAGRPVPPPDVAFPVGDPEHSLARTETVPARRTMPYDIWGPDTGAASSSLRQLGETNMTGGDDIRDSAARLELAGGAYT